MHYEQRLHPYSICHSPRPIAKRITIDEPGRNQKALLRLLRFLNPFLHSLSQVSAECQGSTLWRNLLTIRLYLSTGKSPGLHSTNAFWKKPVTKTIPCWSG